MHSEENRSEIGCGLVNTRNSCFLNATLQALFHIPSITFDLQHDLTETNRAKCECATCEFIMLFKLTKSSYLPLNPAKLRKALRKSAFRNSKKHLFALLNGEQQDAHEFFIQLLDVMEIQKHPFLPFTKLNSKIKSSIKCSKCTYVSDSSVNAVDICLDIEERHNVQEALRFYFEDEEIKDYTCEACKEGSATKKIALENAPEVLCLTLKRFNSLQTKLNNDITIPHQINLSDYVLENHHECNYKLMAIINHLGKKMKSGHYTAITRTTNDLFYEFNDSYVRNIDASVVKGSNAYMLFFQKSFEGELREPSHEDEEELEEDEEELEMTEVEIIDISETEEGELSKSRHEDEEELEMTEIEVIDVPEVEEGELSNSRHDDKEEEELIEIEIIDSFDTEELQNFLCSIGMAETHDQVENEEIEYIEIDEMTEENDEEVEFVQHAESHDNENELTGHRIFDINFLFKQMKALNEHSRRCPFGDMKLLRETKRGLVSKFHFRCSVCGARTKLDTCPPKKENYPSLNEAAVLGINSVGSGFYHLQEFFAHLDVPTMCNSTYNSINKEQYGDWWNLAKESANKALQEEIELAFLNGNVDSKGHPLIAIICDGSWAKRSYGTNFSSLSGSAAIIGLRTKKILYFDIRSKYCHICKMSYAKNTPPNYHECNINFDGPSSGMETDIIVEGFKLMESQGVRFHKVIADGDANTYKAISDLRLYSNPDMIVEKFECTNHLFRNFRKKFKELSKITKFKPASRKLVTASRGHEISKGIRVAAKHWQESDLGMGDKIKNLEKDIRNAPYHYFGNHDNCRDYFCKKTTEQSSNVITLLKNDGLFDEIKKMCYHYFGHHAKSLLMDYSNNPAEQFNGIIAKYLGGKRINFSLGVSYRARVATAVVQFNSGGHGGSEFQEFKFSTSASACRKLENNRKRKCAANALSRKENPKPRRIEPKKKEGPKAYGDDHEGLDMTEIEYEIAKEDFVQTRKEQQANRISIQKKTVDKKDDPLWHSIRINLLTSSNFSRIINARGPTSYQKILEDIMYNQIEFGNRADVRHQSMYQEIALDTFKTVYTRSLKECGIFIDANLFFLGASPFMLYGNYGIVNIKCPRKAFGKTINDAITKKLITFWKTESNNTITNVKHEWYIEIQGQLHITNRKYCRLMVWLGETQFKTEMIKRDHSYWDTEMKSKLTYFYEEVMLRELVDPRRRRGMELRKYNSETNSFI